MGFPRALPRLAHAAAVFALAAAPAGAQTSTCNPPPPLLSGPAIVPAGEPYALSWTNVLGTAAVSTNNTEAYVVQRASDAAFARIVDLTTTQRSAVTLPPAPSGATALYHRVAVRTACLGPAAILSNVLATAVKTTCDAPPSVGSLTSSPENPPAFSTWVISWSNLGAGAGPGGWDGVLKFRIRRTSALEPAGKEWVVDSAAASFSGPPGDYVFEVRAETSCGAAGPWSPPKRVTVGSVAKPALVLVSEPAPLLRAANTTALATTFRVRNGGTASVAAAASCDDAGLTVSPATFTLTPGATQDLRVDSHYAGVFSSPRRATVSVTSGGSTLSVPVGVMLAAANASSPVRWSAPVADVDVNGSAVVRTLVNAGPSPAAFVGTVKVPWLSVQTLDGSAWDAPLAPYETRTVRILVDRAKRRGETGTEVGAVALTTAGFDAPETLVVTDDGPRLQPAATGSASVPAAAAKTRVLYASFPNAVDAKGVGRFAADLWITNTDAVNPILVSLFFNPVGAPNDYSATRRFDIPLAPGEVRRYRNAVATLLGQTGAYTVEVRSSAPTVSATALVTNTALAAAATASALRAGETPLAAPAAAGSYGFEMRPTQPGEGAKQSDPVHVVSGLAKDANRRSNLLLLETSGYDTTVRITLRDKNGAPILRNGEIVDITQIVPANGTVQLNGDDVFFDGPVAGAYVWATLTWVGSATDGSGAMKGSVVGMSTVIDNRTQDSSLHVGISTNSLNPSYVPDGSQAASSSRAALASLPLSGGPAPLAFPTVHSAGAALASGERPFWRTRLTLTNTNETTQRNLRLRYIDAAGNSVTSLQQPLPARAVVSYEDTLEEVFDFFPDVNSYGQIVIESQKTSDGSDWVTGWADVDVQTEAYTIDPAGGFGEYKTGMEGYAYFHGYSSYQSNLGTMAIDGAENSSTYRTNLILNEVTGAIGAYCDVVIAAYLPGTFVPIASVPKRLAPGQYFSDELFHNVLGLDLTEVTDVRVVVRQTAGDGVFMAFASKIDRASGDPANIFLRPAVAGTGR